MNRDAWPDFARACAILLVILFHARHSTWLVGFRNDALADRIWALVSEGLTPLRMPMFFVVSGMFAATAVGRPWSQVATKRVWNNLYLYLLWAVIYLLTTPTWPKLEESHFAVWEQIGMIAAGDTPAWYLWALVAFFVVARCTINMSAKLLLSISFVLSMVAVELRDQLHHPPRLMLQCLFFFLAGARCREVPLRIAKEATALRLAVLTPLLVLLLAAYHFRFFGIFPVVGTAAVAWAITATSLATRGSARLCAFGTWLGSRTLPVYLMHFVVLTLLLNACAVYLPEALKSSCIVSLLAPLALSGATAVICLAFASLLRRIGFKWLFEMPRLRVVRVR